jgi:hypothetical protein
MRKNETLILALRGAVLAILVDVTAAGCASHIIGAAVLDLLQSLAPP